MASNLLGLTVRAAAMISKSLDDVSFRLALSRKDGDLVLAAAASGHRAAGDGVVVDRLRADEAAGHGDADMAATYWASAPQPVRRSQTGNGE